MADSDVTVEILEDIRDEIRGSNQRLDATNQRLDAVEKTIDQRLGAVETTLLDLAEQQRFVVRYTKLLSERDSRLELRVGDLETRVDKLESR
jgi:hypothetical protein